MIPSILGLIQGAGNDQGCRNVTKNSTNDTSLEPIPLEPLYSVSLYCIFLFILLCISTISFTLLHFLPLSKKSRKPEINNQTISEISCSTQLENQNSTDVLSQKQEENTETNVIQQEIPSLTEQIYLLSIILFLSFLAYGILPAVQSYSSLPYGNKIYHL